MFDDILVVCRKCNKKVHPSELRKENQNSNVMICNPCYTKIKDVSNSIEEIKKEIDSSKEKKIKFYCEACGFKFTRNKNILNKSCPYCSKEAIKQVNVNLIKEIKDIK